MKKRERKDESKNQLKKNEERERRKEDGINE
jgi:hypothetical protein